MNYITYLRVSTDEQKRSGLGIEAQRALCLNHIKQHEGKLSAEFIDYESGRKVNEQARPNLHIALQLLKVTPDCKLLLAKTDRLARDLHFISGLLKENIPIIVAGHEGMTKLEWHMHAMIAEHEADMISQRTKLALEQAKARGVILGAPRSEVKRISKLGGEGFKRTTDDFNERVSGLIKPMIKTYTTRNRHGVSPDYQKIAEELNALGIRTFRGNYFDYNTVYRIITKGNLHDKLNQNG